MFFLLLLILVILGGYFLYPQNSIYLKDQPPGEYFHIDRVQVIEESLLVIIEADPLGSPGGVVVGMAQKTLTKGVYTDFDIPFSPLGDIDTRLESGKTYYAILKEIDFKITDNENEDLLKNIFGKPVQVRFKLI